MKKVETFTFYDTNGDEIQTINLEELLGKIKTNNPDQNKKTGTEKEIKKTSKLSDQEPNDDLFDLLNVNILKDEKEIMAIAS